MYTQRYGALELGFTTSFEMKWNDRDSGGTNDGQFWLPRPPSGWRVLGGVARGHYGNLNGTAGGLVVREAESGTQMLKSPVRYERIWKDTGSGAELDGAIWRPIPPPGYAALGDLCWRGHGTPPLDAVACVKVEHAGRRYVRQAEVGKWIWSDADSGADQDVSVWSIIPPPYPADAEKRLLLPGDLFTAFPFYDKPSTTPVVNVLDLPAVVTESDEPPIPVMTSYDRPPSTTQIIDRTTVVPYTLLVDPGRDEAWRAANTPFYTLQRKRSFEVVMHRDNRNGSGTAPISQTIETGVSREDSEAFSVKTGVTVTVEAGVALDVFSAKTSVSVSLEMGYERRTAVTRFQRDSKTQGLNVPPHAAGCMWVEAHELVPIRRDGSLIGATLAFSVDSYITGEYPAGSGVAHITDPVELAALQSAPDDAVPAQQTAPARAPQQA
ncbi:Vps62-related protein [Lentzea sp.]|uniref:Vps62-related protein n=1 Tax=Lentzea sp. TaxID=56099 RepID=UPI002B74E8CB|nr:Vps62-related protein [Lentzea sp.]HUQ58700.1 Vps62-related protein [Lentzea sp.]